MSLSILIPSMSALMISIMWHPKDMPQNHPRCRKSHPSIADDKVRFDLACDLGKRADRDMSGRLEESIRWSQIVA